MSSSVKHRKKTVVRPQGNLHSGWEGFGEISKHFFTRCQREAHKRNLCFSVTIEFLWDLFLQQNRRCALSGLPLRFAKNYKTQYDYTASLDRLDSRLGYTESNVQWVHKAINHVKSNYPNDLFVAMCVLVAQNQTDVPGQQRVDFDARHREIINRSSQQKVGKDHHRSKNYVVTDPHGNIFDIKGLKRFCEESDLSIHSVKNAMKQNKAFKGYFIQPKF